MDNQDNPYSNPYSDKQDPSNPSDAYWGGANSQPPPPPSDPYADANDALLPPPPTYTNPSYANQSNYQQPFSTPNFSMNSIPFQPAYLTPRRRRRGGCSIVGLLVLVVVLGALGFGGYQIYKSVNGSSGVFAGLGGGSGVTSVPVSAIPTIVIDRNDGPIHVQVGNSSSVVTITTANGKSTFGDPSHIPYTHNGVLITFDTSDFETENLIVTVPVKSTLKLQTNDGEVNVQGVHGLMNLSSNAGSIVVSNSEAFEASSFDTNGGGLNLTNMKMDGSAKFSTNGDGITFSGNLDPNSTYTFDTTTGRIDITLPSNANVHVDLSSSTGTVTSAFSKIKVTNGTIGSEAHGDLGQPPRAKLKATSSTGSVNLKQGS